MDGLRKGLEKTVNIDHLQGKIHIESLLEDLGIEVSHDAGPQWIMCHCPNLTGNHKNGDANPSFGFHRNELKYNCFVCGGGDVVDLVKMMEGLEDDAAVTFLEQHSDLEPRTSEALLERVQEIMHPEEEVTIMPEYPADSLFRFRKIHPYLYERGLTKKVITKMDVGFDDEHCGIVIPHWFMGKLCGWQVRHLAMDGDRYICDYCEREKGESMMKTDKIGKYINTAHFPKINTLYGYDQMKAWIKENRCDWVILVESPMTALYLMSLGYGNVCATFGSFSREQGMLLLPLRTVYFWPDNDAAGRTNTKRAIDSMAQFNTLKIVPVVDGEKSDAANLAPDMIEKYLQNAYSHSLYPLYGLATLDRVTGE